MKMDNNKSLNELKRETNEKVLKGNELDELGRRYIDDKKLLENQIDRISQSNISREDKIRILDTLKQNVEELREQYEENVAQKKIELMEEIKTNVELMSEIASELEEQEDSLKQTEGNVEHADITGAIDETSRKRADFITAQEEYTKKLEEQMKQAEMQQRQIRIRRIQE